MWYKSPSNREVRPYPGEAMAGRPTTREAPPFGKRLAALRKESGLTQAQLADKLGVSIKAVDYYERRAKNPSLELMKKAAEVLGTTVAELAGDDAAPRGRSKRGPVSILDDRFDKVKKLPRAKQQLVARMIDAVLAESRTSA